MKETATKELTTISMFLGLGVVIKLLSDILTRTVLSFLFIDPLTIVTVFLLYKFPRFKNAVLLAIGETTISLILFTATDIWFLRPVMVFIAYGVVKFFKGRKYKDVTKFMWSCFFAVKFNILAISVIFLGLLFIAPDLLPIQEISNSLTSTGKEMGLGTTELSLIQDNLTLIMLMSILIIGVIYAYIPATAHLIIGYFIGKHLLPKTKKEEN